MPADGWRPRKGAMAMNRWVIAAAVLCGLAAAGCEGQYEVRGFVYGVDVEQGFVEVAKDGGAAPADVVPLENAVVSLQVYKITGELADEFPPEEYYTDAQGKFHFELPESLLDVPGRLVIGAKTKYQLTCQRLGYEDLSSDVRLPLDRKRHLRIFLKRMPSVEP